MYVPSHSPGSIVLVIQIIAHMSWPFIEWSRVLLIWLLWLYALSRACHGRRKRSFGPKTKSSRSANCELSCIGWKTQIDSMLSVLLITSLSSRSVYTYPTTKLACWCCHINGLIASEGTPFCDQVKLWNIGSLIFCSMNRVNARTMVWQRSCKMRITRETLKITNKV